MEINLDKEEVESIIQDYLSGEGFRVTYIQIIESKKNKEFKVTSVVDFPLNLVHKK